ncbi:MAG: bifunctional orotidine-5'-phosphate decarboxylase/orotate phosphoribosyltransferase [Gloeomargaritaceae cyanobacterium C42_A2020_066]|nr:bifunctional orotidine-5'-phosphate decarboxylase/orotate phosphoribosyltransferase [Gloeomargaritaceae cyanobacterium C42_A2020_066]
MGHLPHHPWLPPETVPSFRDRLTAAMDTSGSLLCLGLDPNPELAGPAGRLGELRDWLLSLIEATAGRVAAYKPTLGFYLAWGSAGLMLLEEILQSLPTDVPVILDAKHGDLNTSTALATTAFDQWNVDALTLNPYLGQDLIAPFLVYPGRGVWVTCTSSNPVAAQIQAFPTPDQPLFLHVAKVAQTWGTPDQVGLEVGTGRPAVVAQVRAVAPERLILVRSLWQAGADWRAIVAAGLDDQGSGLLVPIPQEDLLGQEVRAVVTQRRDQVNALRHSAVTRGPACPLWMPQGVHQTHPHQDLILHLYDEGCLLFGEYRQASGEVFPYYVDLRRVISNPQLFNQVLLAYARLLEPLTFDRIAGIPYGSLPTATGLALHLGCPMIFPRKEVKAHGTRRLIEGHFEPGETVVVVDDILISGKSALEGAAKLQSAGLRVTDIVVLIDHERGVRARLQAEGFSAHAVLAMSEVTQVLHTAGRLDGDQYATLQATHGGPHP